MSDRWPLIDALRGFALFGVVVSNAAVISGAGRVAAPASPFDALLGEAGTYLIAGKFLALFSLLFGISFGLYLAQPVAAGASHAVRYLRRMLVLLLMGAAHQVLAGTDILMTYALLGVVLLLFRNAPGAALLLGAALALLLPTLWSALIEWGGYQMPPPPMSRAERLRLAIEGPYLDLVSVRARMLTRFWNELPRESSYLTLFLLGLWSARRGVLVRPEEHRGLLRALWWGGLGLTAVCYAAQSVLRPALGGGSQWLGITFGIVWQSTTFIQAITYGAGISLLWVRGGSVRSSIARLGPGGQMALTNYLSVSILGTLLIASTHAYGAVSLAVAFSCGAALWMLQLAWSTWWLRRHARGPFEQLWRTLASAR